MRAHRQPARYHCHATSPDTTVYITFSELTMGTGVPEIDKQHKELIDRLNTLIDAMKAGKGREELKPILRFIADYTKWHFSHEEGCMERNRCPLAKANKDAHTQFINTFNSLAGRIEQEGATVSLVLEVQRQLGDWIVRHIMRVDKHLNACINDKAAKATA